MLLYNSLLFLDRLKASHRPCVPQVSGCHGIELNKYNDDVKQNSARIKSIAKQEARGRAHR